MPRPHTRPGAGAAERDYADWSVFAHGDDYRGALADFRTVAGPIPLVPRSVFGIWFSRYWPYSAADFQAVAENYTAHGLPLDVLRIDMDWHLAGSHGHGQVNTRPSLVNT